MIQAFSDGVGEPSLIHRAQSQLPNIQLVQHRGRVVQLIGLVIESQGPKAALGEICRLESATIPEGIMAEVVGFRNQNLLLMPLGQMEGIYPGCEVVSYTHLTLPTKRIV